MNNALSNRLITRIIVIITATIVSVVSLTTLAGLIFGDLLFSVPSIFPVIGGTSGSLPTGLLARFFIRLAVVTLALSVIIGIINLVMVNIQRTLYGTTISAKINSAVVVVAFLFGLVAPVVSPNFGDFLLEEVQTPIESALAALIFFALVYGAFRILKRKITASAILFVLTIELVLIGALPGEAFTPVRQLTDWLFNVPVNAGARGILLGIAIATLMTGLRVLIGQDRSYGE
ncbi:MAG: hypothetical protein WBC91_25135 [Phototrophicaceae bacterium]|jgi:hypothetical protein